MSERITTIDIIKDIRESKSEGQFRGHGLRILDIKSARSHGMLTIVRNVLILQLMAPLQL